MAKNILITGASGLVGSRLTLLMQQKGYRVSHLSHKTKTDSIRTYEWDVNNSKIDSGSIADCDGIIHLAGAGIADKRWSTSRKKEILESRTRSTALLMNTLNTVENKVRSLISASAIGYYGFNENDKIFSEDDGPGNDFLAKVVKQWEAEVDQINSLDVRVVKLRIGIVLSDKGGVLKEMAKPIRLGLGAPLGNGRQQMSWVHIDDVCGMFIYALENKLMTGAYNAVSKVTTNAHFTKEVAKVLHKPLWLPNVPAFALRIILGEMADLVLKGSRVSSRKIQESGYIIKYPGLDTALKQL